MELIKVLLSILLITKIQSSLDSCSIVNAQIANINTCGEHDDNEGYCCFVKGVESAVEFKTCQYFSLNSNIFSGFFVGSMQFQVSCLNSEKIENKFPIHKYATCGSNDPSEKSYCSTSNIYPDSNNKYEINCCLATVNETKNYCLKSNFPIRKKQTYTFIENGIKIKFDCGVKRVKQKVKFTKNY